MTPPREGLTERQRAEALFVQVMAGVTSNKGIDLIAAALRAAEASALERAAQVADRYDSGAAHLIADSIRALIAPSPESSPATEKTRCMCPPGAVAGSCPLRNDVQSICECRCHDAPPSEPVAPAPSAAEKRDELRTMLQNAVPHIIAAGHFRLWACRCGYCAPLQAALASPGAAGEETHR